MALLAEACAQADKKSFTNIAILVNIATGRTKRWHSGTLEGQLVMVHGPIPRLEFLCLLSTCLRQGVSLVHQLHWQQVKTFLQI